MPAEILFDLASIDLDTRPYTAEQFDAMLPQCGDMRQIDELLWVNDDTTEALCVKYVGDDEFWVPGHIPGRPLLPGVLMIEAGAQASSVLHRLKSGDDRFIGFTRCDDVVFRGQVVPGDTLHVLVRELKFGRRRFVTAAQGLVNGKLVVEAKITGMQV